MFYFLRPISKLDNWPIKPINGYISAHEYDRIKNEEDIKTGFKIPLAFLTNFLDWIIDLLNQLTAISLLIWNWCKQIWSDPAYWRQHETDHQLNFEIFNEFLLIG